MSTEAVKTTPRRTPSPLKVARFVQGPTQQEVADTAGISLQQLRRLERRECRPTLDTATSLARALDTPVEAIFPDADAPHAHRYGRRARPARHRRR